VDYPVAWGLYNTIHPKSESTRWLMLTISTVDLRNMCLDQTHRL
jgi:hypothetical protein